jgi:hypothetical protein
MTATLKPAMMPTRQRSPHATAGQFINIINFYLIFQQNYTALGHKLRFRHCELAKQSRVNKQFTGLLRATALAMTDTSRSI